MDIKSRTLDDGRIEVSFVGTQAELEEEFGPINDGEEAADDESKEDKAELLVRKKYCCACSDGTRKTIKASSGFSAAAKCLERCKGGFSVGGGGC